MVIRWGTERMERRRATEVKEDQNEAESSYTAWDCMKGIRALLGTLPPVTLA